jgi:hypothetical protein
VEGEAGATPDEAAARRAALRAALAEMWPASAQAEAEATAEAEARRLGPRGAKRRRRDDGAEEDAFAGFGSAAPADDEAFGEDGGDDGDGDGDGEAAPASALVREAPLPPLVSARWVEACASAAALLGVEPFIVRG